MIKMLHNPIVCVLTLLKICGGFPYTLTLNEKPESGEIIRRNVNESSGDATDKVVLKRCKMATIWSVFLLIMVIICGCMSLYFWFYVNKLDSTSQVIYRLIMLLSVIGAGIVQTYLTICSSRLRYVVLLLKEDIRIKGKILHRDFSMMYVMLGIDLLLSASAIYATVIYYPIMELKHGIYWIVSSMIHLIFWPVSSAATSCLIYSIAKTLSIKLDQQMQNNFGVFLLPLQESSRDERCISLTSPDLLQKVTVKGYKVSPSQSCFIEPRPFDKKLEQQGNLSSIEELWKVQNTPDIVNLSKFIDQLDRIIESLMYYEGGLLLIIILVNLVSSVAHFFWSMITKFQVESVVLFFGTLMKVLCILCSADALMRRKEFWLRKLRSLTRTQTHIKFSKQVEVVISQLENGVKFTPCGLFVMDRRCIIPVLSTIVTYVIIALQFQVSEDTTTGGKGNSSHYEESW